MKIYDITLTAVFKKPLKVKADSISEATKKAKQILTDTDLIHFCDDELHAVVCETENEDDEFSDDEDEEFLDEDEEDSLYDELY